MKKRFQFGLICVLFTFAVLIAACGNDDDDDENNDDNGAGGDDDDDTAPGACDELVFNLHEADSMQVFVTLADMTPHMQDMTDGYDFVMAAQMPEPPTVLLGPDVAAVDLGNGTPFDEVDEAPEDGYRSDGDDPVIGTNWRTGGNGTDGHTMSGRVYVLALPDGTYAKISVTYAKQGEIHIDAYRQADGSTDLTCAFTE